MPKQVLIVDDESDICNLISECLNDLGLDVVTAQNGIDALNQAKQVKFDLIMLDIHLPDIDGVVVYEKIREMPNHTKTPIIFLTALAQGTRPQLSSSSHADYSIIPKPVSLEKIQRAVSDALGKE
ncbi:MAG: hypothetical protein A3G33_04465 [Omnitrophica bacterium RIFCSPLOWO2_12_FULL_44_17]|uniref:Response regulatory domain-containing protein n=1 Tax=Candidatus Danuiimicrobium aquiferis TaxID=1801832 RepID=A0A1G1KQL5_9BACT|nr:MAG: hypothetical protein A3B72_10675 [Omnitrophica bacterium RIFCSPHIGHO2_02_FULL_45_28]OGW92293.1 MAG: hypothetical protein A3E74_09485 [Omnitrophica bacterium RIFCSPHIGHO2_12_FULL_44_12]OGW95188.1 MAG: hypothetical protein A3G33_04465 [Omnitrophica bacterium RIFCSPLOWO2_12_FULL_44_17]OGX01667.1 MAG: hypothetical protein A3J12_03970 [Omnitrophica bacterium RIFCSPLOWO2_02_FULL_44_11]